MNSAATPTQTQTATTYRPADLVTWATDQFKARGVDEAIAETVAEILVEGDLLGHDTHGLALLGPYLRKVDEGVMARTGAPDILSSRAATQLWDGRSLPGPWLTVRAVEAASAMAREAGSGTVVVHHCGHIACLAAYLERPARDGLVVEILSSDPSVASVAPFGGTRAVFTPNPLAFGFPASGDPILIDISSSITTNGMSARLEAAGQRFPKKWLLDGHGNPTDDPAAFHADPPGTIQLLGGLDVGHKGYGLALLVEAMTGGLAAFGRAEAPKDWGATIMVRVTDPDAFGGVAGFSHQLDCIIEACKTNPPADPARPVRLPGHRGLERKRAAEANGLKLAGVVQAAIKTLAADSGIALPPPTPTD
jgi:LDH2 family malate/lactate/ureidoglycolate dehydrogenase